MNRSRKIIFAAAKNDCFRNLRGMALVHSCKEKLDSAAPKKDALKNLCAHQK